MPLSSNASAEIPPLPDCTPYHVLFSDPSTHVATVSIFSFLYTLIFVLGLVGNVGLILATIRHRSLQSVQNIFIVNLAISDVILCLLSIPLTPVTHIYKEWYFGALLCRVVGAIQAIGMFIGTFSLCAIAIDRYFRLVIAPGRPLRRDHAIRITWTLWIISLLVTLPYVYHMKLKTYTDRDWNICGEFCTEEWPNNEAKRFYTAAVFVIQFAIPFTIMTICYHSVFAFLRKRAHSRLTSIAQQVNLLYVLAATAGGDTQQHKAQLSHLVEQKRRVSQQKRRVTVILVLMVFIFGLTALPHNVVNLMNEYDESLMQLDETDFSYLFMLFAHCMAMTCCVANPVLYAFLNPEFRELVLNSVKWAPRFVSRSFQPTQSSPV